MMVLFEIYQRFKGHLLNELRVSFDEKRKCTPNITTKPKDLVYNF